MAKKSFSHLYTEGFFSEALQTQRFSVLRNFREIEKEIERNVSFPPSPNKTSKLITRQTRKKRAPYTIYCDPILLESIKNGDR